MLLKDSKDVADALEHKRSLLLVTVDPVRDFLADSIIIELFEGNREYLCDFELVLKRDLQMGATIFVVHDQVALVLPGLLLTRNKKALEY